MGSFLKTSCGQIFLGDCPRLVGDRRSGVLSSTCILPAPVSSCGKPLSHPRESVGWSQVPHLFPTQTHRRSPPSVPWCSLPSGRRPCWCVRCRGCPRPGSSGIEVCGCRGAWGTVPLGPGGSASQNGYWTHTLNGVSEKWPTSAAPLLPHPSPHS